MPLLDSFKVDHTHYECACGAFGKGDANTGRLPD